MIDRLYMNDNDRFETESGHEYRSGDTLTVRICGEWVTTRVEYAKGRYYLLGVPSCIVNGIEVLSEQ